MPFTQLLNVANLRSPFKDETLKEVVAEISAWLDSINVENLTLENSVK